MSPQAQVASLADIIREDGQQALVTPTMQGAPHEPQAVAYPAAVHRTLPPAPYRHAAPYRSRLSPARPPVVQPPAPRKPTCGESQIIVRCVTTAKKQTTSTVVAPTRGPLCEGSPQALHASNPASALPVQHQPMSSALQPVAVTLVLPLFKPSNLCRIPAWKLPRPT